MYSEFQPEEGYRLLPRAVEDGLRRFFGRGTGFALFAFLMIAWLSLVTWSVDDPSLTHVTREPASNFLGYFGAVISDLMLQTFGIASAAVLLAPMFWALDLVLAGQLKGSRWKLLSYAASVLMLAGAFSSVPKIVAWPLNHGYGGIAGDGIIAMVLGAAKGFAAPYDVLLSGGILGAAGVLFACASIGIDTATLKRWAHAVAANGLDRLRQRYGFEPVNRPARRHGPRVNRYEDPVYSYRAPRSMDRHWHSDVGGYDEPQRRDRGSARGVEDYLSEEEYQARRYGVRLPTGKPKKPVQPEALREPPQSEPVRKPAERPQEPAEAAPEFDEIEPHEPTEPHPGRDLAFDEDTDEGSRRIAAKFAPVGGAARAQLHREGGPQGFGIEISERRHAKDPYEVSPKNSGSVKSAPKGARKPEKATSDRIAKADCKKPSVRESASDADKMTSAGVPKAEQPEIHDQPELPGLFSEQPAPRRTKAKAPARPKMPARGKLFGSQAQGSAERSSPISLREKAGRQSWKPESEQYRQRQAEAPSEPEPPIIPQTPAEPPDIVEPSPEPGPDKGHQDSPRPQLKMAGGYHRPSLNLLSRTPPAPPGPEMTQAVLRGTARLVEDVLQRFGVNGSMSEIHPGPVVTAFQFAPEKGTNTSRVIGLADDIARAMSVSSARVVALANSTEVMIELPNVHRAQIGLREILCSDSYKSNGGELPVGLGVSMGGQPVVANLAGFSNTLIAGAPGSGKSTCLKSMILSIVYRNAPSDCRFMMIDSGFIEFSAFNGVGHLVAPVISEIGQAGAALDWLVAEIDERAKRMAKLSARSLDVFNNRVRHARRRGEMIARTVHTGFCDKTGQPIYEHEEMEFEPMPHIVVFIDDLCDLMAVDGLRFEDAIVQIGARGNSVGVHLVAGSKTTAELCVTKALQESFKSRIVFKLGSKACSRKMLGDQGAEHLLEFGDMVLQTGPSHNLRVHTAHVTQDEFEAVAQSLREAGGPQYLPSLMAVLNDSSYR